MNVVLIRHAESQFNTKESTHLDSGLTINGLNQAYETALFLRRHLTDIKEYKIVTSPFLRTWQTANVIKFHTNVYQPIKEDWELREHIYALTGYVEEQFPLKVYGSNETFLLNEVESDDQILERMKNFWNSIDKQKKLIIISHGTPIQTLTAFAKGVFEVPKWDKKVKNCSISLIHNGKLTLEHSTTHLKG